MAIPQLEESQPVLNTQKVNSLAAGYEEFARTLASISKTTAHQAEEMVADQSQAMLMQASAQSETIKTNAQIEMIKHPDNTKTILDNTASSLDKLNQSAFVNSSDRRKLQFLNAQDFNQLRVKAAGVSFAQAQKAASISFWDSYPVSMKQIQDALEIGDLKRAKILEENLHNTALNAAKIGVISPEQFSSIRKSSFDLYSRTEDLMKMLQNMEGHSASDFHAAVASPFESGNFGNVNYPVDQNTQWMANHYNVDRSFDAQLVALYNDTPVNWGSVALSSDHQYNDFKMNLIGVNNVKSQIQSGTPFNQIDAHIKSLEDQPKLSAIQEGQVKYWKSFKNRISSDNGYIQLMSQTSLGGRYTQDYNNESVAIMNSAKTPEEKFEAIRQNDNRYIGNMIDLGQSQHISHEYIKPIPAPWVNEVKSGFIKDAPVAQALQRIAYVDPQYRPYLADAMKKPNEAMSVYLVGATMGKADTSFQAQLIEANQNRDYSSLLKTGKDETRDFNIWDDISSDQSMISLYTYLGKLPGGSDIQNGFKEAATNYVLYRAAKEGDVNINGKVKYEEDFINNVTKGFDIVDGTRYLFNGESLNLRKADMDYIADYALSQAYKRIHDGRSEEEFQAYIDLNPLFVTNTPDGRIVVVDKAGHSAVDLNGHEAFDQPYTNNMLSAAHKNASETHKYMADYFGFTENIQRESRLRPNFLFSIPPKEEHKITEVK